jgi:hypothetical protein
MNTRHTNSLQVETARDMLIILLEAAKQRVNDALADISEIEFHWEPLGKAERRSDLEREPDNKKIWRVFKKGEVWVYDYTPKELADPPFTTIAWILNHIAHTGEMYLYCIQSGKPEGVERQWDDLPVCSRLEEVRQYLEQVFDDTGEYLRSIPESKIKHELNRSTPAPWGEMRPTYKNIWGGIIGHAIDHAAQINAIKYFQELCTSGKCGGVGEWGSGETTPPSLS